jgi:hypothetical protein
MPSTDATWSRCAEEHLDVDRQRIVITAVTGHDPDCPGPSSS